MRDLIDDPHPSYTAAMMADLTGQDGPTKPPAEPTGAQVAETGRVTRVEAGFGAGCLKNQAPHLGSFGTDPFPTVKTYPVCRTPDLWRLDNALQDLWNAGALAERAVSAIYDMARTEVAKARPLPLVSSEPWEESDDAYRKRLGGLDNWPFLLTQHSDDLNYEGQKHGLPRARLVPTQEHRS